MEVEGLGEDAGGVNIKLFNILITDGLLDWERRVGSARA